MTELTLPTTTSSSSRNPCACSTLRDSDPELGVCTPLVNKLDPTEDNPTCTCKPTGTGERRSAVARSLLLQQSIDDAEQDGSHTTSIAFQVRLALNASLFINVCLAAAKLYAAIASGSLAVLSSLVDSILDLTTQALLCITDKHMHTPSVKYPAGRKRLEPIAVILSATLMGMGALEVVQKSVETLIVGFEGHLPDLDMTNFTIGILGFATCIKIILWYLCLRIADVSPSADALAQDHRNDVFSNSMAIATSTLAHFHRKLWYFDSVGAILISLYIAWSWLNTGIEQVQKLVGKQADPEFVEHIREVTDLHHPSMRADVVRAYHFGNNYLVEIELIAPETMIVRDAHDISLALQRKVESFDNVERAFVHVDYLARGYDEHKDPTLRHGHGSQYGSVRRHSSEPEVTP